MISATRAAEAVNSSALPAVGALVSGCGSDIDAHLENTDMAIILKACPPVIVQLVRGLIVPGHPVDLGAVSHRQ